MTSVLYTLSLHDALPICPAPVIPGGPVARMSGPPPGWPVEDRHLQPAAGPSVRPGWQDRVQLDHYRDVLGWEPLDRKSTRLNSSHSQISYAVFCLKKKNT